MSQEGGMNQEGGHYYVPAPSTWPITGSIALLFMGFGAAFSVNRLPLGYGLLASGFAVLIYMIFGWFGTVARESEGGVYNKQVDKSFRWGMSWFIFSEVMFFAVFFGALFYLRVHSILDLSSLEGRRLWPDFTGEIKLLPLSFPGNFQMTETTIAAGSSDATVAISVQKGTAPQQVTLALIAQAQVAFQKDAAAKDKPITLVSLPSRPFTIRVVGSAK